LCFRIQRRRSNLRPGVAVNDSVGELLLHNIRGQKIADLLANEGIVEHHIDARPFGGSLAKELLAQTLKLRAVDGRQGGHRRGYDVANELLHRLTSKGILHAHHFKEKHAQGPHITFVVVWSILDAYYRGQNNNNNNTTTTTTQQHGQFRMWHSEL
jgi:hypothetical protein